MRTILSAALLLLAPLPCLAVDWKTFDDPKAFLLTDPVAKEIAGSPAADKAAAVQRLKDSLKSKDVEIRRRAALTLNGLGDKSGVLTMMDDLTTAAGRDRDNVVVALRIIKDERAVPALRAALKDKSPYVRCIAAAALGEMKAGKAFDDLVALTKDKERENNGGLNCFPMLPADSACYALGALGDLRAVPTLIELLSDKDLQNAASKALEMLTKQKFGTDPAKWKQWWNDRA